MIQLLAPGALRGRVMSLHSITTRGTGPLGGFQVGTTATFIGVQAAVGLGAVICMLATLVVAIRAPVCTLVSRHWNDHRERRGAARDRP